MGAMKLSVAANYDFDLVSQMAKYPVREVYGRLSCEDCRYCEDVARQAVTMEPAFQREQSARRQNVRQQLVEGRLRHV